MKRFTAMVAIGNKIERADGIEYEGKNWLVPFWYDTPDGLWTMPAWLIPLERFQHQASEFAGASFVVSDPVPKELFDQNLSQALADQYGVVVQPPVKFRTAKGLN